MSWSGRALRLTEHADGIQAIIVPISPAAPSTGEVLIRVEYSSINYKDALAVTGAGSILRRPTLIGGIDLAGVVVESKAVAVAVGQSVLVTGCGLSETRDGGFADYACVPAEAVIALPDGMTTLTAMTLGTAGFTAALALHQLEHNGLRPGGLPVAITGASGGVGSLAIDLLSAQGYCVHAITGKRAAADYLRQLGASEVLLSDTLERDSAALGRIRFAAAIDNLGGEWLAWLLRSVVLTGSVASVGLAAGAQLNMSIMPFILRGVNVLGITSANTRRELREQLWQRLATDWQPVHLAQIRSRIIPLEQVPTACAEVIAGTVQGRTVVRIAS